MRSDYWDQCLVLQDEIQVRRISPSTSPASSTATSSASSSPSSSSSDVNVTKWDEALRRCIDVTRWTKDGRDAYDGEKNRQNAALIVALVALVVCVLRCLGYFRWFLF